MQVVIRVTQQEKNVWSDSKGDYINKPAIQFERQHNFNKHDSPHDALATMVRDVFKRADRLKASKLSVVRPNQPIDIDLFFGDGKVLSTSMAESDYFTNKLRTKLQLKASAASRLVFMETVISLFDMVAMEVVNVTLPQFMQELQDGAAEEKLAKLAAKADQQTKTDSVIVASNEGEAMLLLEETKAEIEESK